MSLEKITSEIEKKLSMAGQINAKLKLDFGSEGAVFIDATQNPVVLNNEQNADADTVLNCSMDLFKKIVKGEQDPTMAFMMGKLKVTGNMAVAMKLSALMED